MKKLTITFLLATFFTFFMVFSTSQGQDKVSAIHSIVPDESIVRDEITEILTFTGPDRKRRVVKIKVKRLYGPAIELWLDGKKQKKIHTIEYKDFKFCNKVKEGTHGAIQIPPDSGNYFVCHSLKDARDGSFFIGNHVRCPYFVKPWGIIVELCPHSH